MSKSKEDVMRWQIEQELNRLAAARDQIEAWAAHNRAAAQRQLEAGLAADRAGNDRTVGAARDHFHQTLIQARRELAEVEKAAGVLAAAWDDPRWQRYEPPQAPPSVIRLGEAVVAHHGQELLRTPFLAMYEGHNLLLYTGRAGRERAAAAARAWALRLLATVPPGRLRLRLMDPAGIGDDLAIFMHLRQQAPDLVGGKVWTQRAEVEKALADLTGQMETVTQSYLLGRYQTLAEYNQQAGTVAEPYYLLVVLNVPNNLSEEGYRRLVNIARNGPRCGVKSIITVDTDAERPRWCDLDLLTGVPIKEEGNSFIPAFVHWPGVRLELDAPPAVGRCEELLGAIGAAARGAGNAEYPFEHLAPWGERWWTGTSAEAISVPIGRWGSQIQSFELGRGIAHHALVAGRTGSGKSTLMHVLITGLALTYSPEELELYLVDFKKGVEFQDYAHHALPHARVVAVEGEREFGLSVLRALDDKMKGRSQLFTGVRDLPAYRAQTDPATGRPRQLSRILLLVDEFQEFFAEDDALAREAALLLDRIARQGRSFGVHALLGSQTLAGAGGLSRSTMDQMAVRIALMCSDADSRLILGEENPAARLLTRPGEGIYNAQAGAVGENNRFQVAWLSASQREGYLQQIQERAAAGPAPYRKPIVFEGSAPARLEGRDDHPLWQALEQPPRQAARSLPLYLGEPVEIKPPTAAVLARLRGRNLLIAGRDAELAAGMVVTALLSLAALLAPDRLSLQLADLTVAGAEDSSYMEELAAALPSHLRLLPPRRLTGAVADLYAEVQRRAAEDVPTGPTIVLAILGLQRARDLRLETGGMLRRAGEPAPPSEQLATILKEGPEVGVHVIAWCDAVAALNQVVDRRTAGEFGLRVALSMAERESAEIVNGAAASRLAAYRALLFNEERAGQLEKFRPYGRPPLAWLRRFGTRLEQR